MVQVMILMGKNPFRGPLEGVALKIETFSGPKVVTSKASAIWAQKSRDFTLSRHSHAPPHRDKVN
jgi:hypothetical protein